MSLEGTLWLSLQDLTQTKYNALPPAFFGLNGVFNHFQMNVNNIRYIQTFVWRDSNESRDESQYQNDSKFRTESSLYTYQLDNNVGSVEFRLQFYRKIVENEVECSLFLKLFSFSGNIESVKTEMDIICHCDNRKYRGLMRWRTLDMRGSHKGAIISRSMAINADSDILWHIAIRMDPNVPQKRRGNAVHQSPRKNFRAIKDMHGDIHVNRYYNKFRSIDRSDAVTVVSGAFSAVSNDRTVSSGGGLSQQPYAMDPDTLSFAASHRGSLETLVATVDIIDEVNPSFQMI